MPEGLLWVDKTVAELQLGDIIYRQPHRHVLDLRHSGDQIEVTHQAGFSPNPWLSRTTYPATDEVRKFSA